jgi:deazaflavin-dependent oxidoreductase (nitroreductase family)
VSAPFILGPGEKRVAVPQDKRAGGRPGAGTAPLLLLTVPGRSTRTPHTIPVAYLDHEGGWIVVGIGMGGSTRTPQWYLNLRAASQGHVQIGAREHDVTAHLPNSAGRGTLWPHIAAQAPHFAKWQARTGRTLPVIILTARPAPR